MEHTSEYNPAVLDIALQFHEAYERLAPSFGYETREETREFNCNSPNGKLMLAVVRELLDPNKGKAAVIALPQTDPPTCPYCGGEMHEDGLWDSQGVKRYSFHTCATCKSQSPHEDARNSDND